MRRRAQLNKAYPAPSWIFGFAGQAQFGLIAGDPSHLLDADRERLLAVAQFVSDTSIALAAPTGVADRLDAWDIVAVGIPVDVVERFSGRRGISVVMCCGAARRIKAGPVFFTQAMLALRNTIAAVLQTADKAALERLSLLLQEGKLSDVEHANQQLDEALGELAPRLGLLASCEIDRRGFFRKSGSRQTAVIRPNLGSEPLSILCHALAEGMEFDRKSQLGYFMPLSPPYGDLPNQYGVLTTHHYFGRGAFVCHRWSGTPLMCEE